ncbi:hypothetical protein EDD11_009039, partial [Mortierella claussenii]
MQHNNTSSSSLLQNGFVALVRRNSLSAAVTSSGRTGSVTDSRTGAQGGQSPILRLMPIQNEQIYFDESEDDEDDEDEENGAEDSRGFGEEDKGATSGTRGTVRRSMTASPSFLEEEELLTTNSRLGRSDSYEYHRRDRADFQKAKDEETEDLSYLSPRS